MCQCPMIGHKMESHVKNFDTRLSSFAGSGLQHAIEAKYKNNCKAFNMLSKSLLGHDKLNMLLSQLLALTLIQLNCRLNLVGEGVTPLDWATYGQQLALMPSQSCDMQVLLITMYII